MLGTRMVKLLLPFISWRHLSILFSVLLAFAIPFEHKYDKLFRLFSLTLIPEGIDLPKFFDKKIYFYSSDLIALALSFIAILAFRIPFRRFFSDKGSFYLWILFAGALFSIFFSPLHSYAIPYIRLWQLLTPILLFSFLAHAFHKEERERIGNYILGALLISALIQSAIAILQYMHQGPLGLRLFGEPSHFASIEVPGGNRWIFDSIFQRKFFGSDCVIRAAGTLPHSNVLGGFLCTALLASYSFFFRPKWRPWMIASIPILFFAMCLTYSRSALFSWMIATLVWLCHRISHHGLKAICCDRPLRLLGFSIVIAVFCSFSILYEQMQYRGGIFNYNQKAQASDEGRIQYQKVALQIIADHPWIGGGFQQISLRALEYLPHDGTHMERAAKCGTHNIYLYLAAETGLFSLAAFLLFLANLLLAAIKAPFCPQVGSLIAILAALLLIGLCDFYPILFQQGKLLFFIAAGLLAAQCFQEKESTTAIV